jgi:hypothetical protein
VTIQIDHEAFDRATQLVADIAPEGDALTSSSAERLDALLPALEKLPRYRGLSYRGYAVPDGCLRPRTVLSGVLVATSHDPRVATENFSATGLYAVIGRRGRDLSAVSEHGEEREVVFRPGSMFLPIKRFDVDGLEVSVIEELDPDNGPEPAVPQFTLEQLEEQMRDAVREARERAAIEVTSPGKFVGPLT